MNMTSYQQASRVLRRAGFVKAEIDRLYQFQQDYQPSEVDQPVEGPGRLQLSCWLVATGELTNQLPEMSMAPAGPPLQHGGKHLTMRALFSFFSSRRRKEARHP